VDGRHDAPRARGGGGACAGGDGNGDGDGGPADCVEMVRGKLEADLRSCDAGVRVERAVLNRQRSSVLIGIQKMVDGTAGIALET
jgi:hypothetical protein